MLELSQVVLVRICHNVTQLNLNGFYDSLADSENPGDFSLLAL